MTKITFIFVREVNMVYVIGKFIYSWTKQKNLLNWHWHIKQVLKNKKIDKK